MKSSRQVGRRPNSGIDRTIRPPYSRSNERAASWTTLDTCRLGAVKHASMRWEMETESGFLRHGRAKRMTGFGDANTKGPRHNVPRARGYSSRLTRLSLVGLLRSRARLCFTEQHPLWIWTISMQTTPNTYRLEKSKTDISASRVAELKTDISALRLPSRIPTCHALAKPRFFRIIQRGPTNHPTLSVFKRR